MEAGNGVACDTGSEIPEVTSPGDEAYEVGDDGSLNGRTELPDDVEQVTIASVEGATSFYTVEDPDLEYAVNGVATPEFEPGANYESDVFAVQCGAVAANTRVQELLAPGTVVWLEVDEAYWGGNLGLNRTSRHVWIELDGRFRLLAEVLISEGHGVAAPERPGTGRGDAMTDPPIGIMYRDALRAAQQIAIETGAGLWTACG
jgi:endonuclease YncB( thermonuclease family)